MIVLEETLFRQLNIAKRQLNYVRQEISNLEYALKSLDVFGEIKDVFVGYASIKYVISSNSLADDLLSLDNLNQYIRANKINKYVKNNNIIIELPNPFRQILLFGNTISEEYINNKPRFEVTLGIDYKKNICRLNLENNPLLITGKRNSGKRNLLNVLMASLLLKFDNLAIDLVDTSYDLGYLYKLELINLIEITSYLSEIENHISKNKNRVIIINDLVDLSNEVLDIIALIKYVKKIGVPIIIFSSDPEISNKVLPYVEAVVAFELDSEDDSLKAIGIKGAENLLGKGDSIVKEGYNLNRIQTPLYTREEMEDLIKVVNKLI